MFSSKSADIIYRPDFLQLDKESSEIFQRFDRCFQAPSVRSWLHFGCCHLLQIIRLTAEFFFVKKKKFFEEKCF